jgi:hypothetical protein
MLHGVTARPVHKVKDHKVGGLVQVRVKFILLVATHGHRASQNKVLMHLFLFT